MLKDVVQTKGLADVGLLEAMSIHLARHLAKPIAPARLAGILRSKQRKTTPKTAGAYLSALSDAYLVVPCPRYDICSKRELARDGRWYFADLGILQFILGDSNPDRESLLKNAVFVELKRRGFDVYVGTISNREIDFVARKGSVLRYYQIIENLSDKSAREEKLTALRQIPDHHPKTVLTMDPSSVYDREIICQNVIDFLLEQSPV